MYSHKFVIVLCVLGLLRVVNCDIKYKVKAKSNAKASNDFKVLDSIYDEPTCTSQGGLCTLAVDCPTGHLVEQKGLCPAQRSKGVECCYGLSVKETRCEKRGGICQPGRNPCNKIRIYPEVTDCKTNTTCCILVA